MVTNAVLVCVNCASAEEASAIAKAAVDLHLAACASVGAPVRSVYWWQGERQETTEYPLTLKTGAARFAALETEIRRQHSYETPEIIALPVVAGSVDYLRWIEQSVQEA